ncbi:MAG: ABC transporter ATP-binding protein [Bacteroidales bacterium]|nr:ABC transporter ATP-binding protein [Bacteroidales bacterium]
MTAIEFENISKQYRLGLVSTRTLSHDLNRWWTVNVLRKEDPYLKIGETNDRATKGQSDYVWALKDINFKVEQGDVVGIIGKNGAGKSTLLKLLSKVTAPTTGHIRARGRIASLLEVGTGFHSEMTGRENIYMNGAILGMTKQEIRSKLDEIVDFSGCERYLDTPVKRYSSGMTVRLGFAIAAHLDPEILVVDEVLAVGDAEFQKKAIGKMKDVSQGEGRTVLFVSHNMASIKQLCQHSVLIEKGTIKMYSDTEEVVKFYIQNSQIFQHKSVLARKDRQGNQNAMLESIQFADEKGNIVEHIVSGRRCTILVHICNRTLKHDNKLGQVTIAFNNAYGERVLVLSNQFIRKQLSIDINKDTTTIEFILSRCPLNAGEYSMAFYMDDSFGTVIDWIDNLPPVYVWAGDFYNSGNIIREGLGMFLTDFEVNNA